MLHCWAKNSPQCFVWQALYLVALLLLFCGRCGFRDIDLAFVCQAGNLRRWAGSGGALGGGGHYGVLCRRGIW